MHIVHNAIPVVDVHIMLKYNSTQLNPMAMNVVFYPVQLPFCPRNF